MKRGSIHVLCLEKECGGTRYGVPFKGWVRLKCSGTKGNYRHLVKLLRHWVLQQERQRKRGNSDVRTGGNEKLEVVRGFLLFGSYDHDYCTRGS